MLRCNEVAEILAGPEKARGGWRQWWAVRLHLLMCDKCREYSVGMRRLRRAARLIWRESRPEKGRIERLRHEVRRAAESYTEGFK